MTLVTRYIARVRDLEGNHPTHGGDWFRVTTLDNPRGEFGTRAWAQDVLDRAIANYRYGGLAGHTDDVQVDVDLPVVKVNDWLYGNIVPIADVPYRYRAVYRDTLMRAALAASRYGHRVYVSSSFRFYADQLAAWNRYLAGGPLAARPGTSDHEFGLALDIPNARNIPALIRELRRVNLIDDVASEIWHVSNHAQRRLDWYPHFDERSRDYPVTAVAPTQDLVSRTWLTTVVLDQGREGACTGFATAHELDAEPDHVEGVSAELALQLYHRAQQLDEWPGENYSGSSVLAAVTAAKELGYIAEFRWAFGEDDLAIAVSNVGPAVLGITWYEGMSETDENGYIEPTGAVVGGHAIACIGIDVETGDYLLLNSWSAAWGRDGVARIKREHVRKLLAEGGEACIPLVRRTAPCV